MMTSNDDNAEELPREYSVQFIDPSPRMARDQRERIIHHMAGVLGSKCPDLRSRAAIIETLTRADFDPRSIAHLWQVAVTAAQGKKAAPRLH
jgi:hypothetical protein